jgi:hypothetical protein
MRDGAKTRIRLFIRMMIPESPGQNENKQKVAIEIKQNKI